MKNQLFLIIALVAAATVAVIALDMKNSKEDPTQTRIKNYGGEESFTQLTSYLTSDEGAADYANALLSATELSQWRTVVHSIVQQTGVLPTSTEDLWARIKTIRPQASLGYESSSFPLESLSMAIAPTIAGHTALKCEAISQEGCALWLKIDGAPSALWGTYYLLLQEIKQAGLTDWSQIRNDGQAAAAPEVQHRLAVQKQTRLQLVQHSGQPLVRLGENGAIYLRLETDFEHKANVAYYRAQQTHKNK